MHECFALRDGRCKALVVRKCQGATCPFFKTEEQYAADQQRALERFQSLESGWRTYLKGKYGATAGGE